jgi:CzcA family heavy metal efflux pump
MFERLIALSLRHRMVVLFAAVSLLVWGAWTAQHIPLDVLPDLTAPTVTILVEAPGMVPVEMESLVTFPIESSINGAPGVRRVRSATAVGVAVIWVEFDWGRNVLEARQTVNEKIALAAGSLPPGVKPPYLAPVSSIMGEIVFLTLESDHHSAMDVRTTADTVIRRRLLSVPGVAQVIPTGGDQKQYQVLASPELLREYAISIHELEAALRAGSINTSAGFRTSGGHEYLIQGVGRAATVGEIGAIAITSRNGRPILVRDVADVAIGPAIKRGEGSHNARPAVVIGIQKQPGANTLELTARLDQTIDEIQANLPSGMKIDRNVFRQADFISRALDNLALAIRDGSLLVVLVVIVFLMNFRAAVTTLIALPLSVVTAVIALDWLGLTINTMTLGGLTIAMGELVDDAIIDVENIMRRLRENAGREPVVDVIYRASCEIRGSVVFATLIVGLVFLPLFSLTSVEGRLLAPLAFAYVISLAASLLVALTITPALCSYLLPNQPTEPRLIDVLKRLYRPLLRAALAHPRLIALASSLLVIVAAIDLAQTGRAFLPDFNEGTLTLSAVTIPGTSLADSDSLGRGLERILLEVPEVVSTARRTGRAEFDEHVQGVESAEVDVNLRMKGRPKAAVLEEIRQRLRMLPGTNVTIGQPISHRIDHMLSGTRANIALKIFGDDLTQLSRLARRVRGAVEPVAGVVDLTIEQQSAIPLLRVRADAQAASRYGLTPGEVASQIQTAFVGTEVNRILEGQLSFPLVMRFPLSSFAQVLIDSPSGAKVPLSSVTRITEDRGPNFISREGVQRKIVVQCNVAGRALVDVVNEIRAAVGREVTFPRGYRIEYGGQFASEAQASSRLLVLTAGVICAIFLILATAFGSSLEAALIMLNLPLALVGGVLGVHLSGGVLSVASLIGFITLFGIATRNGIMLVSHIRHLRVDEGVDDLREAVERGALERLAPILMTALAAGLALVPIALGAGQPGSEIQAPMAMVILFGLFSSTALNMLVVPTLYLALHRKKG